MKFSYDRKYNIAYIQLRPRGTRVRTIQASDEVNIDLAADGSVYGIELLNANAQLAKGDTMDLVNVTTGRKAKFQLVG
jgi:uncharacterized protein YuzE